MIGGAPQYFREFRFFPLKTFTLEFAYFSKKRYQKITSNRHIDQNLEQLIAVLGEANVM